MATGVCPPAGWGDDLERFVRFEIGDLIVYVARELLDELKLGTRHMTFYIDGYGRFRLTFAESWGE